MGYYRLPWVTVRLPVSYRRLTEKRRKRRLAVEEFNHGWTPIDTDFTEDQIPGWGTRGKHSSSYQAILECNMQQIQISGLFARG